MKKVVNLFEYTGTQKADTAELGEKVFKKLEPQIKKCLENKEKVVIDFSQITSVTTKFLDKAIGNLFSTAYVEKLLDCITFSGLDDSKKRKLKWALNIAIKRNQMVEAEVV